jgi:hypothetical protein
MTAATPVMSACFETDPRVLTAGISWFSCSLFARPEISSATGDRNGPKLRPPDWLAEVQAALSIERNANSPGGDALPAPGIGLTTAATEKGGRLRAGRLPLASGHCVPIRFR